MLTPKSLLTWMIASFCRPWSIAYFAAPVPWSASAVMVRKKTPLALPSWAMRVSVGDEEAGEICTTPAGAVTEVRTGSDTDEMMPPMMAGTRLRSTSWRAWSTATLPWLWESGRSMAGGQRRKARGECDGRKDGCEAHVTLSPGEACRGAGGSSRAGPEQTGSVQGSG